MGACLSIDMRQSILNVSNLISTNRGQLEIAEDLIAGYRCHESMADRSLTTSVQALLDLFGHESPRKLENTLGKVGKDGWLQVREDEKLIMARIGLLGSLDLGEMSL